MLKRKTQKGLNRFRLQEACDWLITNRKFRIERSDYPDAVRRVREGCLSYNQARNVIDLLSDIEILEDRVKTQELRLLRRKSYDSRVYSKKTALELWNSKMVNR